MDIDTHMDSLDSPGLEAKYSCVVCHKRKVKCDRARPCSNCVKNNVDCEYKAPPAPKRKKKSTDSQQLAARVRKYEEHLKKVGATVDESGEIRAERASTESSGLRTFAERGDSASNDSPRAELIQPKIEEGTLLVDAANLQSNLWVTLSGELSNPRPFIQDQAEGVTEDESTQSTIETSPTAVLFGQTSRDDPITLYPRADIIMVLWRTFLTNIDPLTKMIHPPSFERVVQLSCQNIHAISRSNLTLLYSIFLSAVTSMSDEECRTKTGNARSIVLKRFTCLTQKCLIKAGLLRTADVSLLTAFMYYLLSIRLDSDPQTVWSLSALALRISQRIGLHRDTTAGLTLFEIEMRRRIWRQVLIFEWATSELAGSSSLTNFFAESIDFEEPRNLNDTDIDPNMTELPPARSEATDMIFCMLRYQFGQFFRIQLNEGVGPSGPGAGLSLADKDKYIDEMERKVEHRFLQYCDPINPVHSLVTVVARAALCSMRIRAHHPRQYPDGGANLPEEERARLFEWSFRALKYDNMIITNETLRGFHWHIRSFFQYHPVIYILTWVREKRVGDEVEEVWRQLDMTYRSRPELIERRVGLHIALAMLALQAWDARETELRRLDELVQVPEFIANLKARSLATPSLRRENRPSRTVHAGISASASASLAASAVPATGQAAQTIHALPPGTEWDFSSGLNVMDFGIGRDMNASLNWAQWDQLMLNPEMQLNQDFAFNALDGFFVPMQN